MLRSGFFNIAGAVTRMLISVVSVPLLIRTIGLENYGLWSLALAVIGLLGLAEAGLSVSTTVFVSKDIAAADNKGISQTLTAAVGTMLIFASAAAIVIFFGANLILDLSSDLDSQQWATAISALKVGAVVVWAQLMQRIFVGIEQAANRYGLLNFLLTLQAAATSVGLLIIAFNGGQPDRFMQWMALVSLISMTIHIIVAFAYLRGFNIRPSIDLNRLRDFFKYSLATWTVSISSIAFTRVDRLIVGSLLGMAALGVYAGITTITSKINSLSAVPVQPILPTLSALRAERASRFAEIQVSVRQASQINVLLAFGLGVGLFSLAGLAMDVMNISESVENATTLFRLAIVIYAVYSLNVTGYYVLLSINELRSFILIQVISAVITLLAIGLGASIWDLAGAVAGNALYLSTISLTILAMKKLLIDYQTWLSWIRFPSIWFVTSLLIFTLIPDNLWLSMILNIILFSMLGAWFFRSQNLNISEVMKMVSKLRSPKPSSELQR